MNYNTFTPSKELSAFVKCFWTLDADEEHPPAKQRILPDGCMEMIFHYGDLYRQYFNDDNAVIQPRYFVFGQITTALEIEPTGRTGIFAVRFYPQAFAPFSTIPVSAMTDRAVPLNELFGDEGMALGEAIVNAVDTAERIKSIEQFLLSKLDSEVVFERAVLAAVELITELNGRSAIGDLSAQLQINRRQLERKFATAVGLSPKQLSRIIRLQTTLKMLLNKEFTNLTEVAYENDFYDQAHFVNDFKEFTGLSPKDFYADHLRMTLLFLGTT